MRHEEFYHAPCDAIIDGSKILQHCVFPSVSRPHFLAPAPAALIAPTNERHEKHEVGSTSSNTRIIVCDSSWIKYFGNREVVTARNKWNYAHAQLRIVSAPTANCHAKEHAPTTSATPSQPELLLLLYSSFGAQ